MLTDRSSCFRRRVRCSGPASRYSLSSACLCACPGCSFRWAASASHSFVCSSSFLHRYCYCDYFQYHNTLQAIGSHLRVVGYIRAPITILSKSHVTIAASERQHLGSPETAPWSLSHGVCYDISVLLLHSFPAAAWVLLILPRQRSNRYHPSTSSLCLTANIVYHFLKPHFSGG